MRRARPLVYSTNEALRQWAALCPDLGCLENRIGEAIEQGSLHVSQTGGYVFDNREPQRWTATVERRPGVLNEDRRMWLVVSVNAHDRTHKPRRSYASVT